jgi:hypothetical protein
MKYRLIKLPNIYIIYINIDNLLYYCGIHNIYIYIYIYIIYIYIYIHAVIQNL